MNILSIISKIPEKRWCEFLNKFKNYKIYIIVDDNDFDLTEFISTYKNIVFMKIDDVKCKTKGYIKGQHSEDNKLVNGWDKALYYFAVENTNYDFIWFMEDDVFFYSEDTLVQIDNKYKTEDLISNIHYPKTDTNRVNSWSWDDVNIAYNEPLYSGSMNSVRVSKRMVNCINDYVVKNKQLFYFESLFPTVAIKNSLKYVTPKELVNVDIKAKYERKDINKINIYHPEDNLSMQLYYRNHLIPHLIIQ
jgi:hypothetical protein